MKNPVVDPEAMFPEVEKMIYKQVWKCSRSFRIPFEIASSQASLAFVRACYSYKPEKASFVTWCFFKVSMSLLDIVEERAKDRLVCMTDIDPSPDKRTGKGYENSFLEILIEESPDIFIPEDSRLFREDVEDMTTDLSPHAKQFLSLLLSTPPELIAGKRPTAKQLAIRIKRRMVNEGIERPEVERAFAELRDCLNTLWV
jgi:hypothetical protein